MTHCTMHANASLPPLSIPTEREFFQEALEALPVCISHCQCPDRWHTVWAGLKATGLLRGVHAQAPFLRETLRPYWVQGGNVLIAGAADTGSLDVLNALYGDTTARYTVVDHCEAPLRLISKRAETRHLQVRTVLADLDAMETAQPWDLVFIHYTLSFMDNAARMQVFRHLKQTLAPNGVIACALRFVAVPAPTDDAKAATEWLAATHNTLRTIYAGNPDLLASLTEWLPVYARARRERERLMPHATIVREELAAAGFKILSEHDNPGQTATGKPDLSRPGTVQSCFLMAGHADHA
jgi:SAM-dependent methyltransferase